MIMPPSPLREASNRPRQDLQKSAKLVKSSTPQQMKVEATQQAWLDKQKQKARAQFDEQKKDPEAVRKRATQAMSPDRKRKLWLEKQKQQARAKFTALSREADRVVAASVCDGPAVTKDPHTVALQQAAVVASLHAWKSTVVSTQSSELPLDESIQALLKAGLSKRLELLRARAADRSFVRDISFDFFPGIPSPRAESRVWEVETLVDCLAADISWRRAVVQAVCRNSQSVLIRYTAPPLVLGGLRGTEWVDVSAGCWSRLRPQGTFTNDADLGMPSTLPVGTDVLVLQPAGWTNAKVSKCVEDIVTVELLGSGKHDWRLVECKIGSGRLRLPSLQKISAERQWQQQQVVRGDKVQLFNLPIEYSLASILGQGAYGVVCAGTRADTKEEIAVKKIGQLGQLDALHSIRMLREVKCLRHLQGHPNIVMLHEVLLPPSSQGRAEEIYLVFERVFTDLGKVIRSAHPLSAEHIQWLMYQCLSGLAHCHRAGVMHRDLKPENLLLEQDCTLKITDFGLAVGRSDPSASLSNYVVTRWYRSPELLLAQDDFEHKRLFTPAIDIWSVGCILGELLRRKPLFPGDSSMDQLRLILTVLGSPAAGQDAWATNPKLRKYLSTAGPPRVPLVECIPKACSPIVLNLLESMLCFDPAQRPSATECLKHDYFGSLRDTVSPCVIESVPLDLQVDPSIAPDTALDALLGECARVI